MIEKAVSELLINFVDYVRLCYFLSNIGGVYWFEERPLVRDSQMQELVAVFAFFADFLIDPVYSDVFFDKNVELRSTANGLYAIDPSILGLEGSEKRRRCVY